MADPTLCPPDYTGLPLDLLAYLYSRGVVRDPDGDKSRPRVGEEARPACFFGGFDDAPDHAVTIIGPYNISTDSDTNPIVEFTVGVRTGPWDGDQLKRTTQAVLHALTIEHRTALTAGQDVMYCKRVRVDAPTRDDNNRWRLANTYQLRPHTPE